MTLDDAKASARDRSKVYGGKRHVVRPYPGPVDHFEDRAHEDLLPTDLIIATYENGMAAGGRVIHDPSAPWPEHGTACSYSPTGRHVSSEAEFHMLMLKALEQQRTLRKHPWPGAPRNPDFEKIFPGPRHPVDALKDLGVEMTPEAEVAARAVCDEPVKLHKVERIAAVIDEWRKGCSNSIWADPVTCEECSVAALRAIREILK